MDDERLIAISLTQNVEQLHSIPQVACRLFDLTRLDDYDMREVSACLAQDPALSAKLLRMANSAQFALYRPIASVQRAVALLGRRSLRLAALSFGLIGSFADGLGPRAVEQFWRRAVAMAIIAKKLAGISGDADPFDCYSAALLADVGTLAFAQRFGNEYLSLIEQQPHDADWVEEERRRFGCGHPALSASLLAHWNLPEDIVAAVDRHHAVPATGGMTCIVQHSHLIAELLLASVSAECVLELRRRLNQRYSITLDGFIDFCRDIQADLSREWEAYEVSPSPVVDCGRLMEAARLQFQAAAFDAALDLDSIVEPLET